jgi:nucleoside-diphosphate-sugar epimerase
MAEPANIITPATKRETPMTPERSSTTVLVTGASGFLAMHCIIQLLEQGYRVRGTLRSLAREAELRASLAKLVDAGDRLELVEADLLKDAGWEQAVRGCTYVLHVASPFPLREPKSEDELIRPAVEGTLRVLRAAAQGGVRRVVQTSSVAAIAYGHAPEKHRFDENDWSNVESPTIGAYAKSKTLAERAAWDFIKGQGTASSLELAVINPGYILGPLLDAHSRSSGVLVTQLMLGKIPGVARMHFQSVDVRDVAAAHLAAMTTPEAAGQRFVCVSASFWMKDVALILRKNFAGRGYNVHTLEFPSWLVRLIAIFDKNIRLTVDSLDQELDIQNQRIQRVLGWQPRSLEEMVVSMGESLIANKIV